MEVDVGPFPPKAQAIDSLLLLGSSLLLLGGGLLLLGSCLLGGLGGERGRERGAG